MRCGAREQTCGRCQRARKQPLSIKLNLIALRQSAVRQKIMNCAIGNRKSRKNAARGAPSEMRSERWYNDAHINEIGMRFDPVENHRKNVTHLPDNAIISASYPGAGAAYLGNILLELGLNYFDPYTELLVAGVPSPVKERMEYRARLSASKRRDASIRDSPAETIIFKTHRFPEEFAGKAVDRVMLLVRDPRDSLFSYYNWRLGFSEEGEHGSFSDFLTRTSAQGLTPVEEWATFHRAWLSLPQNDAAVSLFVVKFEDLKTAPRTVMEQSLSKLRVNFRGELLDEAIAASSFDRMRMHEDNNSPGLSARIMRRGMPGEWHQWYAEYQSHFLRGVIESVAYKLGYCLRPR